MQKEKKGNYAEKNASTITTQSKVLQVLQYTHERKDSNGD